MSSKTTYDLSVEAAEQHVARGAAYLDLRPVREYLDVHVPGSLSMQFEFGPGFNTRARDCIPLSIPLVLLDHGEVDLDYATSSLRGKGFAVVGVVEDGLRRWGESFGTPSSCEVYEGDTAPEGLILDVGDPRLVLYREATFISIERLWDRAHELAGSEKISILAGVGVRAALAVGMLERSGARDLGFWYRRA